MNKTKVISVVNQKGGVGKTTTAVNLSTALAAINKKVLLIDLDPQGNLSTGLGIKSEDRKINVYDLIMVEKISIEKASIKTKIPYLNIIPSGINLSGIEFELSDDENRNKKLYNKINNIKSKYDFIIIDCPPSLGLLTINALTASNAIVIPIQCEYYALEGLGQLLNTVRLVQRHLNKKLEITGILMTMYDGRLNLSKQVVDEVNSFFKEKLFKTFIHRNVRLSEAPSFGKPALLYDANSTGAQNYMNLTEEILQRVSQTIR